MKTDVVRRQSQWIHSPALDLIVGCGGWSLPLLMLGQVIASNQMGWAAAFYGLALFFNYPHYMATLYRAYRTKEDFARYRLFTVYITIALAVTLLVSHFSPRLVPWLFTIYVTWSPWHYMGQNFGLSMMFIRRSGLKIDRKDRDALWTAFLASYGMIFLSFHTNASVDPNVVSLGLPPLLDTFRIPLMAVFLILGIYPLGKLVRKAGWQPMLPAIALYVTEFLWFVLPTILELTSSIRLPPGSYSAGVLALMHSAQYIWITSYYARQESAAGDRSWTWTGYFTILVLGGIALFIPGPWLATRVFGVDFTVSVLAFTAIINIHHFILDGAVWKLREKRIASFLFADTTPTVTATSWMSIAGRPWRPITVAAAVFLLILAGMDQVRYDLAAQRGERSLMVAAELTPNDSTVQARLAGVLIQKQRYDEAYEHYRPIVEHLDPNVTVLVNFGLLCERRNETARAVESFNRALTLNPNSAPAHLHLAETLQKTGKLEEAAEHFERYRSLIASDRDHILIDPNH